MNKKEFKQQQRAARIDVKNYGRSFSGELCRQLSFPGLVQKLQPKSDVYFKMKQKLAESQPSIFDGLFD